MILVPHSRFDIEHYAFTAPSIAICVAYPTGRLHRVFPCGNLLAVLHLRFSDCLGDGTWCFPDNKDGCNAVPMTANQADLILDFVEEWQDEAKEIHAACKGGVSRSRGILNGLARLYDWTEVPPAADGPPNSHVLDLVWRRGADRVGQPRRRKT